MKKAGWIATVAAGVVLVGGGAWGATTLAALPTTSAGGVSDTAAPVEPEPSATPEATPTPTVEATTEVESEAAQFAAYIRPFLAPLEFHPTDDEVADALSATCEAEAAGESDATDPITPFVDADAQANQIFVDAAIRDYC